MVNRLAEIHSTFLDENGPDPPGLDQNSEDASRGDGLPKPYGASFRNWIPSNQPPPPPPPRYVANEYYQPAASAPVFGQPATSSTSQVHFSQQSRGRAWEDPYLPKQSDQEDRHNANSSANHASSAFASKLRGIARNRKQRMEAEEARSLPAQQGIIFIRQIEEELVRATSMPLQQREKVFRDLQRRYHPDKNLQCPEAAKLAFQRLMQERTSFLRDG
jgi:hypothetical protein